MQPQRPTLILAVGIFNIAIGVLSFFCCGCAWSSYARAHRLCRQAGRDVRRAFRLTARTGEAVCHSRGAARELPPVRGRVPSPQSR